MSKKAMKTDEAALGLAQRLGRIPEAVANYFRQLKYEWQKVTFPTRKELVQSTLVVFVFTVALMAVISLYDVAMSFVFNKWILPLS